MTSMRRTGGIVAVLIGYGGIAIQAQSPDPKNALRTAKVLKCEFTLQATGTWTDPGEPQADVRMTKLSLGFDSIDTDNGTADVTGTYGAPYIVVRLAGGYLHFMQVGAIGYLHTTTVFDKVARSGRLKAVHTRHEYTDVSVPGYYTSRPEQYYGDCEIGS